MREDSSNEVKILHTGDFHLGATFKLYRGRKVDEERKKDLKRNVEKIVDDALKEKINVLLITGDIFHYSNPRSNDFVFLSEQIGKLTRNGIKVVAIAGNHDKPKVRNLQHQLNGLVRAHAPNFYFYQQIPNEPLIIELKEKMKKIGIVPIPYIDPRIVSSLGKNYGKVVNEFIKQLLDNEKLSDVDYKILMAHLIVSGAQIKKIRTIYTNEPKVTSSELVENEFDYVALGHIHQNQEISKNIHYSGSIERIDFSEADEYKYYNIIYCSNTGVLTNKFILKTREMVRLTYKSLKDSIDPVGELKNFLKSQELPNGCLLKLDVKGEPRAINVLRENKLLLESFLESELGVLGYEINIGKEAIVGDVGTRLEDVKRNLSDIVLEYIDSLNIDDDIKIRAKRIAKDIMGEVGQL